MVALLASVFCSSTAVALLTTVLGKQIFDLTGSELALGLLGLAEFAPAALLVFVTGPLADRIDRRKLASVALGLQAVTVGGLAWYSGTNPTSVGSVLHPGRRIRHRRRRSSHPPSARSPPTSSIADDSRGSSRART